MGQPAEVSIIPVPKNAERLTGGSAELLVDKVVAKSKDGPRVAP